MSALIERGRRARRNGSPESRRTLRCSRESAGFQLAGASLLDSLLRDGAHRVATRRTFDGDGDAGLLELRERRIFET